MPEPTFDARVLGDEDGLLYSIAAGARRRQIVDVLGESFCREPMGEALGLSASDLAPLVERSMPECTTNGLSVVAVPRGRFRAGGGRLHLPSFQIAFGRRGS